MAILLDVAEGKEIKGVEQLYIYFFVYRTKLKEQQEDLNTIDKAEAVKNAYMVNALYMVIDRVAPKTLTNEELTTFLKEFSQQIEVDLTRRKPQQKTLNTFVEIYNTAGHVACYDAIKEKAKSVKSSQTSLNNAEVLALINTNVLTHNNSTINNKLIELKSGQVVEFKTEKGKPAKSRLKGNLKNFDLLIYDAVQSVYLEQGETFTTTDILNKVYINGKLKARYRAEDHNKIITSLNRLHEAQLTLAFDGAVMYHGVNLLPYFKTVGYIDPKFRNVLTDSAGNIKQRTPRVYTITLSDRPLLVDYMQQKQLKMQLANLPQGLNMNFSINNQRVLIFHKLIQSINLIKNGAINVDSYTAAGKTTRKGNFISLKSILLFSIDRANKQSERENVIKSTKLWLNAFTNCNFIKGYTEKKRHSDNEIIGFYIVV